MEGGLPLKSQMYIPKIYLNNFQKYNINRKYKYNYGGHHEENFFITQ